MGKFDPYSRRVFRRRRTAWLRTNVVLVAVVVVGFTIMLAIATAVVAIAVPAPFRWYLLGAVHIGLGAAALHLLHSAFLAHDREAIWHVRGAWGEDNTRRAVKWLLDQELIDDRAAEEFATRHPDPDLP